MLILSRKTNESIVIDGRIRVKIIRVDGEVVKVGIEAPADVPVHRQEVYDEIQRNNMEAAAGQRRVVPRLSPRSNANSNSASATAPVPSSTATSGSTPAPVPPGNPPNLSAT